MALVACFAPQSLVFSSVLSITLPPFHPSLLFFSLSLSFASISSFLPKLLLNIIHLAWPQTLMQNGHTHRDHIRTLPYAFHFDVQTRTVLWPPFIACSLNFFGRDVIFKLRACLGSFLKVFKYVILCVLDFTGPHFLSVKVTINHP